MPDLTNDSTYFLELQTNTGWGRMLKTFAEWCAPQPGWRVLDVASGPGILAASFAGMGCRAFGADLDPKMFYQRPLHPDVLVADVYALPLPPESFDMLTCSNMLFFLPDPDAAFHQLARLLRPGGQLCVLNPSEQMSVAAAADLAQKAGLTGLPRDTIVNYAGRAETAHRWTEQDLAALYRQAGMRLTGSDTRMGPGLVRFGRGVREVGS